MGTFGSFTDPTRSRGPDRSEPIADDRRQGLESFGAACSVGVVDELLGVLMKVLEGGRHVLRATS